MGCIKKNPAARRFMVRSLATSGAYIVFVLIAVLAFVRLRPTGPLAYALAVLPGVPIAAMIGVYALYLKEEKDDFQRAIMAQSMLWSIGATLTATTVWGFMENFVHAPHLQPMMIFPLYCFFWALITPLVLRRYK